MIDPATGMLIAQGVIASSQAITQGGPRRQYRWNMRAARATNAMNRENARWQLEEQRKIQQEQRLYDSPEQQMARYKAAGLNPHLIYGGGAGSSGGTFPISAPGIAPSRVDAPMASYPDIGGRFLQAGQALAQTELSMQKVAESEMKTSLQKAQEEVLRTNPMLNPAVSWAVKQQVEAAATAAAQRDRYLSDFAPGSNMTRSEEAAERALDKAQAELNTVLRRLGLMDQQGEVVDMDIKVKNEILESKQFQNDMNDIWRRFMEKGELTMTQVYQLGLMLLNKVLGGK